MLSLPPAFNLSHDQTLQFNLALKSLTYRFELISSAFKIISFGSVYNIMTTLRFIANQSLNSIESLNLLSTNAHTDCLIVFLKNNVALSRQGRLYYLSRPLLSTRFFQVFHSLGYSPILLNRLCSSLVA